MREGGPLGPARTTLNFPGVDDLGVNLAVVAHALGSTDSTSFRALWLETKGDAIVLRLGVIRLHLHVPAFHPREDRLAWLAETLLELLEHPGTQAARLRDGCEIIRLPEHPGLAFTNVTIDDARQPLPGEVVLRARNLDALFMTQVQEDVLRAFLLTRLTDRPFLWSAADRGDLLPAESAPPSAPKCTNGVPEGALPVMLRVPSGPADWDGNRQVEHIPVGYATLSANGAGIDVTVQQRPTLGGGARIALLAGQPGTRATFSPDPPKVLHATAQSFDERVQIGTAYLDDDRRGYLLALDALPFDGTFTLTNPELGGPVPQVAEPDRPVRLAQDEDGDFPF